nr:wat1-related protein [Quercus suber]
MEEQEESARVGSESRKRERLIDVLTPYILCIIANFFFAGLIIVVKVSLDRGFSPYVLVPYGQAFGALTTGVLALLYERDNHNKISIPILRNIFFLGLLGMEKLDISQRGAQTKIVGTVVAFAGATLMTLYKGIVVVSLVHSQQSNQTSTSKASLDKNWLKGSFMLVISNISYSAFYILQTKTIKVYPSPLALTALTCLSGTLLSTIMAAIFDHKLSSWRLSWNITLLAPIYSGVAICGITYYLQTLVSQRKGPVFMTAFRPLCTLLTAIMGLLILREALHLGSILGAMLIILGLYMTLWGIESERKKKHTERGRKSGSHKSQEARAQSKPVVVAPVSDPTEVIRSDIETEIGEKGREDIKDGDLANSETNKLENTLLQDIDSFPNRDSISNVSTPNLFPIKSSVAISTEGDGNEMVQEKVVTAQANVTSVMETEFCGIDSTLMLTLKLAVVSNSTTTMGSPKSQPIIKESSLFYVPLISVVEVKSDTWVAEISDIDAALPMHDSPTIITLINSISQQSQQQVFNMVNTPDKEKSATTTMQGNESDQSN